jgi:hypothetical protein
MGNISKHRPGALFLGPWSRAFCAVAAVSCLVAPCDPLLAAQIYKWVDKHGKVHYGDRPPAAAESEEIKIDKGRTRPASGPARKKQARRPPEASEAERPGGQQQAQRTSAQVTLNDRKCRAARQQVGIYQRPGKSSGGNLVGRQTYLSEQQRLDALANARKLVSTWCK